MNGFKATNAHSTGLIRYDREPAAVSGSIQPHGILLVFSNPELNFLQVSTNIWEHLGFQPQDLLGQPLQMLLNPEDIEFMQQELQDTGQISFLKLPVCTSTGERPFDGTAHQLETIVLLELEPTFSAVESYGFTPLAKRGFNVQFWVKRAIAQLRQVANLSEFLQLATEEVRKITGFDRVMVYQFDPQGAGAVVAEARRDDLPTYLGLHYPATDIPDPVRALYQRGLLRFIPDLRARSIELIPPDNPVTQQPSDLSRVVLRGVDPCCVEYHQNMGVAAILVVALIKEQTLWGLISCHHQSPKLLPYNVRETCELLGQFISSELANKVDHEELDYMVKLRSLQSEFVESIAQADDLKNALVNPAPRLLDLVSAQGAAVCLEDELTLLEQLPPLSRFMC
ncbi:MAG: GAF domain-containing protein [Leptolyngbyaceae cyanobacterium RU_5_1]|nr:GAF domain-containing protein [Leptolyngbyaceae cyanobacterium RU_5_1]